MMQPWAIERMTEDRRRELRGLRRPTGQRGAAEGPPTPSPTPTPSLVLMARPSPARSSRTRRPMVGSHIGAWLIRAGTRLGGATVRAS